MGRPRKGWVKGEDGIWRPPLDPVAPDAISEDSALDTVASTATALPPRQADGLPQPSAHLWFVTQNGLAVDLNAANLIECRLEGTTYRLSLSCGKMVDLTPEDYELAAPLLGAPGA